MDENMENEIVLDEDNEVIEVNQEDTQEVELENDSDVKVYTEEEVEEIKSNLRKEFDDNSQRLWNQRWAREKDKLDKENAQLLQIEDVLKEQLGATDRNDLMKKLGDFYQVDMKTPSFKLTRRQEEVLAKQDAEDIKELGENEMFQEAERISKIPQAERSIHDNIVFDSLVKELTETKNKKVLKEKGYDLAILEDNEFKNFMKKLNYNTNIADAVDMYNALNNAKKTEKPVKPASAGSTKSNVTQNQIKDFYTYEETLAFEKKDYDKNPELWEAVQRSMPNWYK